MIDEYLVDSAYLVSVSRNTDADLVFGAETPLNCRWREEHQLRQVAGREAAETDAMAWFQVGSGVVAGSVIKYDGIYYRVETLRKARVLGETDVQFIKCQMTKLRQVS